VSFPTYGRSDSGVNGKAPLEGGRPLRARQFGWIVTFLALALIVPLAAGRASPDVEQASRERARSGAIAHPAAAMHHLLLARSAEGPDRKAIVQTNARLAVELDPDLVDGWALLAREALPDVGATATALRGGAAALGHSWEAQRRLLAASFRRSGPPRASPRSSLSSAWGCAASPDMSTASTRNSART
jgi:hypothetical protein